VQQRRITLWIVVAVAACAAVGGWLGSHIGGGNAGMIVLIAATLGVLGSFLPGSLYRLLARVRRAGGPGQDAT
jgi:outer membrane lipoprotein SlyB